MRLMGIISVAPNQKKKKQNSRSRWPHHASAILQGVAEACGGFRENGKFQENYS